MGDGFPRPYIPRRRESELKTGGPSLPSHSEVPQQENVLAENVFHSMLALERRRAERSRKPFVLMLLDANVENGPAEEILQKAVDIVLTSKRETDLFGWYTDGLILGIIFTEVSLEEESPITETLRDKIETAFVKRLGRERASRIAMSLHIFPEVGEDGNPGSLKDSKLYLENKRKRSRKRVSM
jgi:hypothetical protein